MSAIAQITQKQFTQQGASLQAYNSELVDCLRDLREKRESINKAISAEEKRKADIESKIHKLNEQLRRVSDSLKDKYQARVEFDGTIAETEAAYSKILESSQTLLTVLKREQTTLVSKTPQVRALANVQDLDITSPKEGKQGAKNVKDNGAKDDAFKGEISRTKSKSFFSFGGSNESSRNAAPALPPQTPIVVKQ